MTTPREAFLQQALAAIQSGSSLDEVVAGLTPVSERVLLRRCALVHAFDQRLLDEILRDGVASAEDIPFEQVKRWDTIEEAPKLPGWYRVRDAERKQALDTWDKEVANYGVSDSAGYAYEYLHLAERLVDYFERLGPAWSAEVLYHLLTLDPKRAASLFERLFQEADRAFDLSRCDRLLSILDERQSSLGVLAAQRLPLRRYVEMRTLTAEDYYRTARYWERASLRGVFDSVMQSQDTPWVLDINARGGMGKTMFLRWVVARHCVPGRIPFARIDFDFFTGQRAANEPWLFLADLAEQLLHQLPDQELKDLTVLAREYRQAPSFPRWSTPENQDFLFRFATALGDAPVLIIIDTLEVLRHQSGIDIAGVLGCLAEVHRQRPNLRVILSGRFPLDQHYPAAAAALGAGLVTQSVSEFTFDEASDYLRQRRGITDDALIRSISDTAQGLPIKVAMLADAVLAAGLTLPDFAKLDVDLTYLVERVLKRIPEDAVRWLLRYGVVPRYMTKAFVEQVMQPCLVAAMTGDRTLDTPELDPIDRDRGSTPLWRRDVDFTQVLEPLWTQLLAYASQWSFLIPSDTDHDTLAFHPTVAVPMRRVLQGQRVAAALHEAAIAYYRTRAAEDVTRRPQWLRAVVYHLYERYGADADTEWNALADEYEGNDDALWALASEILTGDLLTDDGEVKVRADGRAAVGLETVARAAFTLAASAVEVLMDAYGPERQTMVVTVADALARFRAAERGLGRSVVPAEEATLIEIILERERDPSRALELAASALQDFADPTRAALMGLVAGDIAIERNDPNAERFYRSMLDRARAAGSREMEREGLIRLCRLYGTIHQPQRGIECCRRLEAMSDDDVSDADRSQAVEDLANFQFISGAPGKALRTLDRVQPPRDPITISHTRVRALLAQRRPMDALAEATGRLPKPGALADATEERASAWEAHAVVLATLHEYRAATAEIETARAAWRELGNIERAARALRWQIEMELWGTGDLRKADELLDQADRTAIGSRDALRRQFDVLRAGWLDRIGSGGRAQTLIDGDLEQRSWNPALVVAAAIEGIRLAPAPVAYVERLLRALAEIDGVPARLAALRGLDRCPTVSTVPPALADAVLALVDLKDLPGSGGPRGLTALDRYYLTLTLIDLERVLGRSSEASRRMRDLVREPKARLSAFSVLELLELERRLGVCDPRGKATAGRVRRFHTHFATYGMLRGALELIRAECAEAAGELRNARRLAESALTLLGESDVTSSRQARALELLARVGMSPSTTAARRSAAEVYERLGDVPSVKRVQSARRRPTVPSASPLDHVVQLRIESRDSRIVVGRRTADGERLVTEHPYSSQLARVLDLLRPTRPSWNESLSVLTQLVKSTHQFMVPLSDLLPRAAIAEAQGRASVASEPIDLRIETDVPLLQTVPWEILISATGPNVTKDTVRYVFRGSSESIALGVRSEWVRTALVELQVLDRTTKATAAVLKRALTEFQTREHLEPTGIASQTTVGALHRVLRERPIEGEPTALIVQGDQDTHRYGRGLDAYISGRDIELLYRRAGFVTHVVQGQSQEQLIDTVLKVAPTILHLSAVVREAPSLGELYLDTGPEIRSKSAFLSQASLTPRAIDSLLGRSPRYPLLPLVVLDVPRPRSSAELARQLLLRNAFAASLFQLGSASAILAMGLAPDDDLVDMYYALTSGARGQLSVGELSLRMREGRFHSERSKFAPDLNAFEGIVGTLGVALFAHDPDLPLRPS